MPRRYKCKKCGVEHAPPTGKHCRQAVHDEEEDTATGETEMMDILRELRSKMDGVNELKSQMNGMERRMGRMEVAQGDDSHHAAQEENVEADSTDSESEEGDGASTISPRELRKDFKLMARAARRLAAFNKDDSSDDDNDELPRARAKGTKSGSAMVPTQIVRKRIDWPHMHVNRVSAGKRNTVAYAELKVEEFDYGFLTMLTKKKGEHAAPL